MDFIIPKVDPIITKEFLLEKNSEENYMTTYLRIPISKGLVVSPLRSDKRPTASFYRNKSGSLIFHDFGSGFHGNFIDVVMYLYKCDYKSALSIIAEDFGYIEKITERPKVKIRTSDIIIEEKEETLIQIEKKKFSQKELEWWKSFGISENTLKKFKVYSCDSIFLNSCYFCSSSDKNFIFGYYGGIKNGNELWRIYQPRKTTFKFMSNFPKTVIQGIRQLSKNKDYVVITKSLKDTMCLYEQDIQAIAPCSENTTMSVKQLNKFNYAYKKLFVFFDNDLAGVKGAHKYKKLHNNIKCIFLKRKYAKDISDLFKSNKKDFQNAISELHDIINKDLKISNYFYIF